MKGKIKMKYDTIKLRKQPKIIGAYSIVGPKEGQGNFKDYFDYIMKDDFFGEKTFEKAERKMIEAAITGAIQKAKLNVKDINILVAGDLLNQLISSSYAARAFNFPYLGVYGGKVVAYLLVYQRPCYLICRNFLFCKSLYGYDALLVFEIVEASPDHNSEQKNACGKNQCLCFPIFHTANLKVQII